MVSGCRLVVGSGVCSLLTIHALSVALDESMNESARIASFGESASNSLWLLSYMSVVTVIHVCSNCHTCL